ncbi:MAG TPA: polysaccharide lyase 6 family protein [Vicinamibacterales bacterium]
MNIRRGFPFLLTLLVLARAAAASAATYEVDSLAALQARITSAAPGDIIVLKDGVYTTTAPIAVDRQGAAGKPIRIVAKTPGGVTLAGTHGFDVVSPAAYVDIDGFLLTHQSGRTQVHAGATHIRFAHNVFECVGEGAYLTIAGDDTEVDRNEFRNKKTLGNMIDVRGAGSQIAQRVHLHHNYFHDFTSPGPGTNGAETIRFGLSGLSMSKGLGVIEQNLFVRCIGENELMSIKSGSNTIRDNTLLDSPGAQLTLRHGNENVVSGNYLRGTDGIRIFGDRNRVTGNYLEGNTGAIQMGNGDGEVADGAPLTSHDRPDDSEITGNTLVDNTRNYFMSGRNKGMGATRTVFANNTIQGGGEAARIEGPYAGAVWRDNLIWQTAGPGSMPPGTFKMVAPPPVKKPQPLTPDALLRMITGRS